MLNLKKKVLSAAAAATLLLGSVPAVTSAAGKPDKQAIPQGTSSAVLDNANYFGDVDPSTPETVDIIMKVQHKDQLKQYIKETVTPGNPHYRKYLNTHEFAAKFGPSPSEINAVTHYLRHFGIQSKVYDDNLVITAHGTAGEFEKAFQVDIKQAKLKGKKFQATKKAPKAPHNIAKDILAILGLSDYSSFASHTVKPVVTDKADSSENRFPLDPSDLVKHYNVQPLYDKGATGAGQTIGIVTLAAFNPSDAYTFWKKEGIDTKPNRIHVTKVDGGALPKKKYSGYVETTLDVEQSGALAPQANINVYVGPNSDPGFVNAFARAISDNEVQQLSVSWGLSETLIIDAVRQQVESPAYAKVFNQLFMEAGAQGISTFAAAGDSGAYDTAGYGLYPLAVDNPSDSPYITAAGGTTLAWQSKGLGVNISQERAWGWDYLYDFFDENGFPLGYYFSGTGGGFSTLFATPNYQKGVSGVNTYTAIKYWEPNEDFTSVTRLKEPIITTGTGSGRNMPDLAMDADPETGYLVYASDPGDPGQNPQMIQIGGTSIVAPQLAGLTALINNVDQTQVGFWNPQIYRFAQQENSPFNPLNTTGGTNDNLFYSGTPGTVYNQGTGLGVPDVAALAQHFAGNKPAHSGPVKPAPKPGHGPGHSHGHGPGKH